MIDRRLLEFVALVILWPSGCSGHTTGNANVACSTIAAPLNVQLPHISVTGASAAAIVQALDAILAAQTPPISLGQTYTVPSLECGEAGGIELPEPDGGAPVEESGYTCDFQVQVAGGQPTTITLSPPSTLAQNLLEAMTASGAMTCPGKESSGGATVANMTVNARSVQYDDVSHYESFSAPNVVVRGADAVSIVNAFAAAGIDDCDPTRYVFLVCGTQSGVPICSYQWMPLQSVGSSYAVPVCFGCGSMATNECGVMSSRCAV